MVHGLHTHNIIVSMGLYLEAKRIQGTAFKIQATSPKLVKEAEIPLTLISIITKIVSVDSQLLS